MRRHPALLLLTLVLTASAAFASDLEQPGLRALAPAARLGRAMILHPQQPLSDADRAALASQGVIVKHALSGGRYLVRVKGDTDVATLDETRVAAIEPLTVDAKLHRSALREVASGRTWATVNVVFHADVTFEDARDAILANGAALADLFTLDFLPSKRIEAKIAPVALKALAADERVFTIAGPIRWRVQSDNADSALLSHVTQIQEAPYNLTGDGVNVSLFELAAAQQDHVEFGGRLTVVATGGASSDANHATHVAGTIGAAGVVANAKGMAPKARIWQHCVASPSNSCKNDWLEDKDRALSALGITVDNNSWGYVLAWTPEGGYPVWLDADYYMGAYDLIVGAPLDEISAKKGILFVHSAGNDADGANFAGREWFDHRHVDDKGDTITDKIFCYSKNLSGTDCPAATCNGGCETVRHDPKLPFDTIGVTAGAKNIITVGAVMEDAQGVRIVDFSSRGPAKDGRIKPEVVARGYNVLSAIPTNRYTRLNGTSMASPVVTGVAALLTEHWRKVVGGTPSPALLKSLIIAGVDDMGNPGPDYTFGFGLVNARNSADLITADAGRGQRIRNLSLSNGQAAETNIVVSQAQSVRIVLNWPDPAIPFLGGDDIATKAIVNDLDVKVIDPAGNEHFPWKLDPVNYEANATRGVNNIDVTEVVEIQNAPAGTYRVVVTGSKVTQGPQTAILVTNVRTAAACTDPIEALGANDNANAAFGNIVPGQQINAGLCAQNDVDFYKFNVTKSGPVSVTITTGDTPLRATLSGNGVNASVEVPANSTRTVTANASSTPLPLTLKIEANGARGAEPQYFFTTSFGETHLPKRRAAGRR
jgi:subtilisin family serine protease